MREFVHHTAFLLREYTAKPLFWLIIIVVIGSFLRLYRFTDFMKIDGDHGRDMLIAKHIVEHKEGLWAAPYALGSHGIVKNSPVYYWMLSAMWFITRSTIPMGIAFAMTSILTIAIGYSAGVALGGTRVGLLFAFFLSISSMLAEDAHAVWPPFLLPLITVCALNCMAHYLKKHQIRWLILFISTLFLGVHIHQSFLPFFGVGLGWALWHGIRNPKRIAALLLVTIIHIILWAYVTGNGAQALYGYLGLLTPSADMPQIFFSSAYRAIQSIELLFTHTSVFIPYGYFAMMPISLILLYRTTVHREKFMSVLMLFIGMLSYGIYGNNGEMALREYYFRAASVVFLFIISYSAAHLIRNTQALIGFVCITGVLLSMGNEQYLLLERGGNYFDHYQITTHALNDYMHITRDTTSSTLIFFTKYLSAPAEPERYIWSAAPQWHLTEDILQKSVVSIPTGYNNFSPQEIQSGSIIYITCIDDLKKGSGIEADFQSLCISPFLTANAEKFTAHRESQQYTLYGENGDIYRTFRYTPTTRQ